MDELYPAKKASEKVKSHLEGNEQSSLDSVYHLFRARRKVSLGNGHVSTKKDADCALRYFSKLTPRNYDHEEFLRKFQGQHNTDTEPKYEIDPITNKKVFRETDEATRKSVEVPVKTFKGYRSLFHKFHPPNNPESELKEPIGEPSILATKSHEMRDYLKEYEGKDTYNPYFAYEPNGQKPESVCPVQEGLKDYDSRNSYESSQNNALHSKINGQPVYSDSTQECLRDHDSIAWYGPVKYNRADSDTSSGLEKEGSKDTLGQQSNRDLSKGPNATAAGLKEFDERVSYGPVLHSEPDGKAPSPAPVQQDAVEKGLHGFDSKADYGARRILKNISLTEKNLSTDKSFRFQHEIDKREDLDLLRPSDVRAASGIIKGTKETENQRLAKRKELEVEFEKAQQLETSNADEALSSIKSPSLTKDLAQKRAEEVSQILTGNYIRDFPEEFQVKWESDKTDGNLTPKTQTDAWGYDKTPQGLELSYQKEIENTKKAEKAYIDGRASKEAFARNPTIPRIQTSLDRKTSQETGKDVSIDKLQAQADLYSREPQGLETSYAEECKLQNEIDPYSKKPQGLETSYVEECTSRQGEGDLSASVSYYSPSKAEATAGEKQLKNSGQEAQGIKSYIEEDQTLPQSDSHPPLQNNILTANPKTAEAPRSLRDKFSKDKELVREIREIYEERYGSIDSKHYQVSETSTSNPDIESKDARGSTPLPDLQEPTIYKILAYDSTMQSVSQAETTSIVTDSASALTPAEVLLRLSNPAKFFPHFEPLQAQGYEIIAGSGDVLVFRKVRSAGPSGTKSESSSSYQDRTRQSTNPIDGMQGKPVVATGNFASPTGFVNYDRPVGSDPPFKSNINVRREEPVFSGKPNWFEDAERPQRKKLSFGKRIIYGGTMVGLSSYAIGVVTEYFKTGGSDGMGPQGL